MAASCSCTAPAPPSPLISPLTSLFNRRQIINLQLSVLLKSCYILQSAVEHSCIPAAAPCSVLQCLNAAATLRLIAGLLHRHCTIATLQGPHFMMGGDGGTAVHLMQSSSIALFMVCACLQSLVYWRVMFWSTDRRRTLPMLHRLSAKWIPPPHLHIT